jgi:hypothetical protein
MTYDQVLAIAGGAGRGALTRAAKRLRISVQTLANWRTRGIPRAWQYDIAREFPELLISRKRKRFAGQKIRRTK